MPTVKLHIGASLYVATSLPATNDTAGFEALSWVKLDGPVQYPQFGTTHADVQVPNAETGFDKMGKGAASGQATSFACQISDGENGHSEVKALADGRPGEGSLKIAYGDAGTVEAGDDVEYAAGVFKDFVRNQGDSTTHRGFTSGFTQNDFTVEGTEPA